MGNIQAKRSFITLALLLMLLTVFTPANRAFAAGESLPSIYHIVALGDSLTAGYEPTMKDQKNPVPYGYVERLYEQGLFHGRTTFVNYGILGLKTEGLKNYIHAVKEGTSITSDGIQPGLPDPRIAQFAGGTAQTKVDLESASVITITIGGNDLSEIVEEAANLTDEQLQARVDELLIAYTNNVQSIINDIKELNGEANIVIADQYQPVPAIANKALYPKLMKVSDRFTETVDKVALEAVAKGIHVKVAHIAKEFAGNEIMYTYILQKDIHPRQSGYEAMAKVFAGVIWGEYRQVAVQGPNNTISVVVKGKELNTPYKPVLRQNTTYVAIKDIVDAMGATSKWDNHTLTATITYGDRVVSIPIGKSSITVNGQSVPVDVPAFLNMVGKESKTYVPVALLAKGLGFDVQFSNQLKTAFVNP
ncbi:stalk domain-containing protein [Paenibacillus sediminis]|uniref:Lysophospholipase L1-like esterase n=1 Tax=Paenibacillus sediminis TaxID=664909 RepID=A0ABS4H653_9BACL|nr:stalk domain-containing protein [Paenibacillus sediminis]MBP1938004.1 lysophospholipase L1-like esterase [Paenibacillus sediminis]